MNKKTEKPLWVRLALMGIEGRDAAVKTDTLIRYGGVFAVLFIIFGSTIRPTERMGFALFVLLVGIVASTWLCWAIKWMDKQEAW